MQLGLFINYKGSEWTLDHATQYLSFTARMKSDSFEAVIDFEVVGRHLTWFIEQLDEFHQTLSPAPELAVGWGETVSFSLKLSRCNLQGDVLLQGFFRKPFSDILSDSAHISQIIELQQVEYLSQFFAAVLANEETILIHVPPKL